jgi:hypothetical protein
MQTVTEALNLQKRQAELEIAMKTPGGIRPSADPFQPHARVDLDSLSVV